jgi:hypothetical protein
MINTPENVKKVGSEFLRILQTKEWFDCAITPTQVIEANDHFDANMAMDQAFRNNGLKALPESDDVPQTDDVSDLWNSAWDYAVTKSGAKS